MDCSLEKQRHCAARFRKAVEENTGGCDGHEGVADEANGEDIDGEASAATRGACAPLHAPRRRAATHAPHELGAPPQVQIKGLQPFSPPPPARISRFPVFGRFCA